MMNQVAHQAVAAVTKAVMMNQVALPAVAAVTKAVLPVVVK